MQSSTGTVCQPTRLRRRDRRLIDRAVQEALATGYASCELTDGTTVVVTPDWCVWWNDSDGEPGPRP
jgi:hypothetical protein